MINTLRKILVKLRILKLGYITSTGIYMTVGLNRKNPVSYLLILLLAIAHAMVSFFDGFIEVLTNNDFWASE